MLIRRTSSGDIRVTSLGDTRIVSGLELVGVLVDNGDTVLQGAVSTSVSLQGVLIDGGDTTLIGKIARPLSGSLIDGGDTVLAGSIARPLAGALIDNGDIVYSGKVARPVAGNLVDGGDTVLTGSIAIGLGLNGVLINGGDTVLTGKVARPVAGRDWEGGDTVLTGIVSVSGLSTEARLSGLLTEVSTDYSANWGTRLSGVIKEIVSTWGLSQDGGILSSADTVLVGSVPHPLAGNLVSNADTVLAGELLNALAGVLVNNGDTVLTHSIAVTPGALNGILVNNGDTVLLGRIGALAAEAVDNSADLRVTPDPSLLPRLLASRIAESRLRRIYPVVLTGSERVKPPFILYNVNRWEPDVGIMGFMGKCASIIEFMVVSQGYQEGKELVKELIEVLNSDEAIGLGTYALEDGEFDPENGYYVNILTGNFITD